MAGNVPESRGNALLRGLFGAFQTGAQARAPTEDIWSNLRQDAGAWLFSVQGRPQPWDPAELTEAGTRILSSQGVNAADVSRFRGIAGSWLGAKQALHALGENDQITDNAIFTSPWARTATGNVPSRYRVSTQWQFQNAAGDIETGWRSDELTGPLTTLSDALSQAEPQANTESGRAMLASGEPPSLVDFQIEQL